MKIKLLSLLTASVLLSALSISFIGCNETAASSNSSVQTEKNNEEETFTVLQSKDDGDIKGDYYLSTNADNYYWGVQPTKDSEPGLKIDSGKTVTIDTLSHEGMLEDQGKNPIEYFAKYNIPQEQVLQDAVEICSKDGGHDFDKNGPHILTSPIYINDAEPGDVIKVEVLDLKPRVPYGVISNRHYKGVLVNEFPENEGRLDGACAANPDAYNDVSIFTPIKNIDGKYYASIDDQKGSSLDFPIAPFLGTMGLVSGSGESLSSVPPTNQGGNIDINELGVGSTLYLPVEVAGGLFYTGDPHFVQGDGEVALTALEGSLRATLKFTLLKNGSKEVPGDANNFNQVFGETEDFWIPIGLNEDLDEAMKQSVRESVDFINEQFGIDRKLAYAYLSGATDYEVSQAVDKVKGIHALISKSNFNKYIDIKLQVNETKYNTFLINDNIYIDAHEVLTALGADNIFDKKTNVLTITYNGKTYKMTIDSNEYDSNGKNVTMTVSPKLQNDKIMIPARSLNKVLGLSLNWSTTGTEVIGNIEK